MSKLFYCIIPVIIGFLLSEFKSPAIEYWTERFGSPEERTLQDYREMKSESRGRIVRPFHLDGLLPKMTIGVWRRGRYVKPAPTRKDLARGRELL